MVASVILICLALSLLFGGLLFLNAAIVFNTARYMAVAPSMLWCNTGYARQLPNFLKFLYDAGYESPWPERPTAFGAMRFRGKLTKLLKDDFPNSKELIQQHLSLWAFVQLHREELQQALRLSQMKRARRILLETPDLHARQQVLAFLNQCRAAEVRAIQSAPSASTDDTVHWIDRLRNFDVLLREHGYWVSEQFAALDHWEEADDAVILDELAVTATGGR